MVDILAYFRDICDCMNVLKKLASGIEFPVEAYRPLLRAFIDETEKDLRVIHENLPLKNEKVLSERMHNIKGASLNLGLEVVSSLLEELSIQNHSGRYEDLEETLNALSSEVDILKGLL